MNKLNFAVRNKLAYTQVIHYIFFCKNVITIVAKHAGFLSVQVDVALGLQYFTLTQINIRSVAHLYSTVCSGMH